MNSTITDYLLKEFNLPQSSLLYIVISILAAFVLVNIMAVIGGLGTYAERKISADIQMRHGPNRVGPYGILQFLADGVKMIMKEDIIPSNVDKFLYVLAPIICMVGVFATLAVIPISSAFTLTDLNIGLIFVFGFSTLVGLGIFFGGYSSNSKWSMLGGMRGAAQIISYEIPVTITVLNIVLIAGTLSLNGVINQQGALPHQWNLLHNPFTFFSFFIYFIGVLAETNRAPFDLPEAESELVSGYHTEYSGMRFAFFALAEYIEVFVVCALAVTLFLGGYNIPTSFQPSGIWGQFTQVALFFAKTFILYYVVIWVRWTLPRLRVDQLMSLCWKYLTPLALFNLTFVALWLWIFNGKSLFQIFLL